MRRIAKKIIQKDYLPYNESSAPVKIAMQTAIR